MIHPQRSAAAAAIAAAALVLAACSPGSGDAGSAATSEETEATGTTTVTLLWDDVAAPAYEESFDAFMAQNPDITVQVEVVPWGDYWERLPPGPPVRGHGGHLLDEHLQLGRYADNGNLSSTSTR